MTANHLRDKYAIVGTGKSRLGRVEGVSALGLLEEAIKQALDEAGLTNKDVDGIVCRGPDDVYSHHQLVGARLGINAAFSTTLDNGGASQILAVALAVMAIDATARNSAFSARSRPMRSGRAAICSNMARPVKILPP
jgi:3-oxoacyl-[acyl-carrier-protein] synthase III